MQCIMIHLLADGLWTWMKNGCQKNIEKGTMKPAEFRKAVSALGFTEAFFEWNSHSRVFEARCPQCGEIYFQFCELDLVKDRHKYSLVERFVIQLQSHAIACRTSLFIKCQSFVNRLEHSDDYVGD